MAVSLGVCLVALPAEHVQPLHDCDRVNASVELVVASFLESAAEKHYLCHVQKSVIVGYELDDLVELSVRDFVPGSAELRKVGYLVSQPLLRCAESVGKVDRPKGGGVLKKAPLGYVRQLYLLVDAESLKEAISRFPSLQRRCQQFASICLRHLRSPGCVHAVLSPSVRCD